MNKLERLLYKFKNNTYELCIHALGCRVIQKVIECLPTNLLNDIIYNEIYDHIETLAEDKYGNYVIQHLLVYGDEYNKTKIMNNIKNNIFKLCNQK